MEPLPEWADEFYLLYSEPYKPESASTKLRVSRSLPLIMRHLPKTGSEVLDLCCGAGAYLFPLETGGYKVTGVDIQGRMIKLAKQYASKRGSKAKILKGDARSLKFKEHLLTQSYFSAPLLLTSALPSSTKSLRRLSEY